MSRFKNPGVVPAGMLAPSGLREDYLIDPMVQSTTRPAGSLLRSSPGFPGTIRRGKNRFQGKGPTGGFAQFEFAEDIGGSGAALMVTPGDTASIEATEWLPEDPDSLEEGSLLIADRGHTQVTAHRQHEAGKVIPDMGDRHPGRPMSLAAFLHSPSKVLREDYRENPIVTVIAAAGVVTLAWIIGNDLEREYRSRRGGGVASETVAVPASGAATIGDEIEKATSTLTGVIDAGVQQIDDLLKDAAGAIGVAGNETKKETEKVSDETGE